MTDTGRQYTVSGGVLTATPTIAKMTQDEVEPQIILTGTLKVRGLEYTVKVHANWTAHPRAIYKDGRPTGDTTRWQLMPYTRFTRSTTGKAPAWNTAASKALDAMVWAILAQLETTWPQWQAVSLRLRQLDTIAVHLSTAIQLRAEAAEHDAIAAKLRGALKEGGK